MLRLGVAMMLAASGTTAAAAVALVEDVNEPLRRPYQVFASTDCTYQGDCAIVFPATTHERTLIQRASCSFALTSGATVRFASLGSQNDNPRNALQVFTGGSGDGYTSFGINSETYVFYDKGQQPRIDVYSTGAPVTSLICTISGHYR